jgi:hypothetical protein
MFFIYKGQVFACIAHILTHFTVFTYRELMQMVLDVTGRRRPILSLPFEIGLFQGAILEKLPVNLFTVTRSQVRILKYLSGGHSLI